MLLTSKTTATASRNTVKNPASPGPICEACSDVVGPPISIARFDEGRHAGEQVVLRSGYVHQRPDQLVVLGRPHLSLQIERDREEPPLGVDLGGVSQQRPIAD